MRCGFFLCSDAAADLHPEPFTLKEFDSAELLMHRLKRYLNMISTEEENVNTRKAAMSYIAKTLFGVDLSVELLDVVPSQDGLGMHIMTTDVSRKTVSLHIEQASHEGLVLSDTFPLLCKTLCRRFVDASEAIRIGAIQTVRPPCLLQCFAKARTCTVSLFADHSLHWYWDCRQTLACSDQLYHYSPFRLDLDILEYHRLAHTLASTPAPVQMLHHLRTYSTLTRRHLRRMLTL